MLPQRTNAVRNNSRYVQYTDVRSLGQYSHRSFTCIAVEVKKPSNKMMGNDDVYFEKYVEMAAKSLIMVMINQ